MDAFLCTMLYIIKRLLPSSRSCLMFIRKAHKIRTIMAKCLFTSQQQTRTSLQVIEALLAAFADGVKARDKEGQVPLHVALKIKAPLEVLSRLLTAWPDAAQVKGSNGYPMNKDIALHYAIQYKAPLAFVTELLDVYPQGAQEKNNNGQVPLHFAFVTKKLAAYPQGAQEKDKYGKVPLHLAAANKDTSLQVIEALLAAFADGVKAQDKKGQVPLHVALENKAPLEVLSCLLAAWPDAAQVKVSNGYLMNGGIALHIAAYYKAPLAFVTELLAAYQQGAQVKDGHGHVPLHFATDYEAPLDVLLALLLLDLPLVVDEHDGTCTPREHAGSWTLIMDHPNLKEKQVLFLVKGVFDKLSSLAAHQQLAHTKDERGREAVSICHADVRALMHTYLLFLGQFELQQGPPVHKSATAVVILANAYSMSSRYNDAFEEQVQQNGASVAALSIDGFREALVSLGFHDKDVKDEQQHRKDETKLKQQFDYARRRAKEEEALSKDDFLAFCTSTFGSTRKVALKFFSNEEQWNREIKVREVGELDAKFVVSLLGKYGPSDVRSFIGTMILHDGTPLRDYEHCIVMPVADRSLDDIYRKERPDLNRIRSMMHDLAKAVHHCHEQGIVHGDLKMLNALRIDTSTIKLIDMDASAVLESGFAGSKFSSGILPPEMFFELKAKEHEEQYLNYWSEERLSNSKLWQTKLMPASFKKGAKKPRTFVVKSFRSLPTAADGLGELPELDGLPYEPIRASTSLDMWSFGLILFTLCSGEPFVSMNRDEDLNGPEAFLKAATWTDVELDVHILQSMRNSGSAVVDLMMKVLRVKPVDRLQSMADVLAHPFIQGVSIDSELLRSIADKVNAIDERTQRIDERLEMVANLTSKLEFKSNRMPHTFIIELQKEVEACTIDEKWRNKISNTFKRTAQRATSLLWKHWRLVFVCPVTGLPVKCGPGSKGVNDPNNGYLISLPSDALKMLIHCLPVTPFCVHGKKNRQTAQWALHEQRSR